MQHEGQVMEVEVAKATSAWRAARDPQAQQARIEDHIEKAREDHQTRTGFKMPAAIEQSIRRDLAAQLSASSDAAQKVALETLHAAHTTIQTVRQSCETLKPTWIELKGKVPDGQVEARRQTEAVESLQVQTLMQAGNLGALIDRYIAGSDDTDRAFAMAIEEAVRLKLPQFTQTASPEDGRDLMRLKAAIQQRRQARWPRWTLETEAKLKTFYSVSDDALMRLKTMAAIG